MADPIAPEPPPAPGETWQQQALGGENPEDRIAVVSPSGVAGTVRRADLDKAVDAGFRLEHPEEVHERRLEKEFGDRPIEAAAESALSTATFGLSDYINPERQREVRKRNEGAALVGGIGGAFIPTGAGGLLSGAGRGAEGLFAGGTLGSRVAGAATRGAVEGAGYGLGAGVSQIALSEEPMTWEGAAATLGSNALGGAVLGGGIGVSGRLLAEGATAAKNYANKQVEAITKAGQEVDRSAFPDIAEMDQKTASKAYAESKAADKAQKATDLAEGETAKEAEIKRLYDTQTEEASKLYKEAEAFKNEVKLDKNFIPSADAETRAMLGGSSLKIKKGLNNRTRFINKRGVGKFQEGLEEQETVLQRVLADSGDTLANAEAESQALLDALPKPRAHAVEPAAAEAVERPFAEQVMGALKQVPEEGRFGDRKAFISEVWKQMDNGMSLDEFKQALVAENRAGRLNLHRADLVQEMSPEMVANSATKHLDADFHFIENEPGPNFVKSAPKPMVPTEPIEYGLTREQAKLYANYAGLEVPKGKSMAINDVQLNDFRRAVELGDIVPERVQRVQTAQALLERNQASPRCRPSRPRRRSRPSSASSTRCATTRAPRRARRHWKRTSPTCRPRILATASPRASAACLAARWAGPWARAALSRAHSSAAISPARCTTA
jgi:hypothetical protein